MGEDKVLSFLETSLLEFLFSEDASDDIDFGIESFIDIEQRGEVPHEQVPDGGGNLSGDSGYGEVAVFFDG